MDDRLDFILGNNIISRQLYLKSLARTCVANWSHRLYYFSQLGGLISCRAASFNYRAHDVAKSKKTLEGRY